MITISPAPEFAVHRDGINIGHIKGNTCYLTEDPGGKIKGQIRKVADADLEFVIGKQFPSDGGAGDPFTGGMLPDETEKEGVLGESSIAPQAATTFEHLMDHRGDKTPAYMREFIREFGQDAFDQRYAGRTVGNVNAP